MQNSIRQNYDNSEQDSIQKNNNSVQDSVQQNNNSVNNNKLITNGLGNIVLCVNLVLFRRALELVEMYRTLVRRLATSSSTRSWPDGKTTQAKSRH